MQCIITPRCASYHQFWTKSVLCVCVFVSCVCVCLMCECVFVSCMCVCVCVCLILCVFPWQPTFRVWDYESLKISSSCVYRLPSALQACSILSFIVVPNHWLAPISFLSSNVLGWQVGRQPCHCISTSSCLVSRSALLLSAKCPRTATECTSKVFQHCYWVQSVPTLLLDAPQKCSNTATERNSTCKVSAPKVSPCHGTKWRGLLSLHLDSILLSVLTTASAPPKYPHNCYCIQGWIKSLLPVLARNRCGKIGAEFLSHFQCWSNFTFSVKFSGWAGQTDRKKK